MDLHSGLPLWIAKNKLYGYYHPLRQNIDKTVVIIGSGITGSLIAHELCSNGIDCCVIDKRSISLGSTAASTSQLQYEIDVPLHQLIDKIGEKEATRAYKDCLKSISDVKKVLEETNTIAPFEQIPTFFFASNKQGLDLIRKEYEVRSKNGLPVQFLDKEQLFKQLGINKPGALYNNTSAQMDSYQAATGILDYHKEKNGLHLYSHTLVTTYKKQKDGYQLTTAEGFRINCRYVIIAAGFEAGEFLPKKVMDLRSTYAIASQPLDKAMLWHKRALIWETKNPYLYMRTTADCRIIVGGEDIPYSSPDKRDRLLQQKTKTLERKFRKLFPDIPFVTEMSWCGTFSATSDGLPFIGAWPRRPHMLFALGYGGNGITFSMLAAQILCQIVQGKEDNRLELYGFHRIDKKA